MSYDIDFAAIERIAPEVRRRVRRTRLVRSAWLSELRGGEVLLKCEHEQLTGSFKVRGPFAKLAENRPARVVAASAGNHGMGLAHAAREHGIPCTIFVPRTVPAVKEEKIRALGAELVKAPFDSFDPTEEYARARSEGALWVSPFDDPDIIAGNGGTTALEIFEDAGPVDAVVLPCGGGGLAIGVGVAARRLAPGASVIGVNSEASPGMWLSRRDGRAHTRVDSKPTIAEGIEGGVSESTYRLGLRFIDDVIVVPESAIARAVVEMRRREGMTIEGSAAAAVAAILERRVPPERKRIVVVLTGGNIDPDRLQRLEASADEKSTKGARHGGPAA
jgi:threonine dehydratase